MFCALGILPYDHWPYAPTSHLRKSHKIATPAIKTLHFDTWFEIFNTLRGVLIFGGGVNVYGHLEPFVPSWWFVITRNTRTNDHLLCECQVHDGHRFFRHTQLDKCSPRNIASFQVHKALFRSARTSCTTSDGSRPSALKIWITYIQAYMPYESSGVLSE